MIFDEKFFLAVAFVAFFALVIKFTKDALIRSLEEKSKQIAKDLIEAKEMKDRATRLLASAEKHAVESELYAQKLIKDAEIEALRYSSEAKKSIDQDIAKRTAAAIERIKIEENIAVTQIKNSIILGAVENISNNVAQSSKNSDQTIANKIIEKSLSDLEKAF